MYFTICSAVSVYKDNTSQILKTDTDLSNLQQTNFCEKLLKVKVKGKVQYLLYFCPNRILKPFA